MSLRRRVILGGLVVALVLLVADIALASTFRSYLLGRVDDQLAMAAGRIPPGPPPSDDDGRPPPERHAAFSEYFIGIADANGNVIQRIDTPLSEQGEAGPNPDPETVRARAAGRGERIEPFEVGSDTVRWRMVALRPAGSSEIVLVGSPLGDVDATYLRMVAVLVVATAAVLTTLAVVAWWVLRQGVRPLAAMTVTASAIADGALSERVAETDQRTEAGRLGRALNTMLARIEDAFRQRAASEARLRRFVADASHELRTPLTSIRGYAELYRAGGLAGTGELDDAMRRVEQEADRMSGLVEDLLLLAKLDRGRPLDRRAVRLDELAGDAVTDARAVEPDRPLRLRTEPVQITADEAGLRQAIGNLVTNACVHTPTSTPVEVSVSASDEWAVVRVADQGAGMPDNVVERVFERFYRPDPARTRASGGAGLGLAIVRSIVDAHAGEVTVESAPGAGTTFTLRLPLDEQDER